MYQVIPQEDRREYTFSQLKEKYNGKWVYLVNVVFSDEHELLKAIPVVIADRELEGFDDGIYAPYHTDAFGRKADVDFTDLCVAIPSVYEVG